MDLPRMELKSEFLYRAHVDVEGFYEVGQTFRGHRTDRPGEGRLVRRPQDQGRDPARAPATGSSCGRAAWPRATCATPTAPTTVTSST